MVARRSDGARTRSAKLSDSRHPRHAGRRAVVRLSTLLRVSERLAELASGADEHTAYEVVSEAASVQCRCFTVIRRYEPISNELVLVNANGDTSVPPFPRIPASDGLSGHVYVTRRAARIDDLRESQLGITTIQVSDPAIRSLMVNPITLNDVYYGSLGLSHSDPYHFDDGDAEFVDGLARLLAATLHRFNSARRVAELLERQRHEEIIASVGDMAFQFAHRIGNHLGHVRSRINFVKQALNQNDRPAADHELDEIQESVQSVLDFSRTFRQNAADLTRGRPVSFSVAELLGKLEWLNRPHHCIVHSVMPPDLPSVFAVPEQVQSIVESLIDNAFQAMPEGGTLTIAGRTDGRMVKISITDTGTGIRDRDREHIFKFGYSTRASSGYGLWSALQKARANGGDLHMESTGETGTQFVIALPRASMQGSL